MILIFLSISNQPRAQRNKFGKTKILHHSFCNNQIKFPRLLYFKEDYFQIWIQSTNRSSDLVDNPLKFCFELFQPKKEMHANNIIMS